MSKNIELQLRKAARQSGLSMLQLSKRAKMPYASVHNFVANDQGLSLRSAAKLAAVLALELQPVGHSTRRKGG